MERDSPATVEGHTLIPTRRSVNAWTESEDSILKAEYHKGIKHIGTMLPRRTTVAIQQRAQKFGLKVAREYSGRKGNPRFAGKSLPHTPDNAQEGIHSPAVAKRLAALLTEQMNAQSKRWGFDVGKMQGWAPAKVVRLTREDDAT